MQDILQFQQVELFQKFISLLMKILQINFAISLHAANTEIRLKLMPINRAYKLPDLMEAIKYYTEKTGQTYYI